MSELHLDGLTSRGPPCWPGRPRLGGRIISEGTEVGRCPGMSPRREIESRCPRFGPERRSCRSCQWQPLRFVIRNRPQLSSHLQRKNGTFSDRPIDWDRGKYLPRHLPRQKLIATLAKPPFAESVKKPRRQAAACRNGDCCELGPRARIMRHHEKGPHCGAGLHCRCRAANRLWLEDLREGVVQEAR